MKYFRMDSDLPDWPVWDNVQDEVGSRDYHAAFTTYMVMYALIAQEFRGADDQQLITISIKTLAKRARISRQKCVKTLTKLGQMFDFSLTFVGKNYDETPEISALFVQIYYPNFLKKQRKFNRNGDGKFTPTDRRVIQDKSNTRQDKCVLGEADAHTHATVSVLITKEDTALAHDWRDYAIRFRSRWSKNPVEDFAAWIAEARALLNLSVDQMVIILEEVIQNPFWAADLTHPLRLADLCKDGLRKLDHIQRDISRRMKQS